jgi:putative membrane protein
VSERRPDADLSREHLANERTFLAWTRTGMAMMGLSVVIARLRFEVAVRPPAPHLMHAVDLGLLFAGAGVATVVLSTWRYYDVRRMLREGRYEPWTYGPLLFGGGIVLMGLVTLFYLLERAPAGAP